MRATTILNYARCSFKPMPKALLPVFRASPERGLNHTLIRNVFPHYQDHNFRRPEIQHSLDKLYASYAIVIVYVSYAPVNEGLPARPAKDPERGTVYPFREKAGSPYPN